jgi:hypothetical protein
MVGDDDWEPTDSTIHFHDSLGTLWVLTNWNSDDSIAKLTRYQYNDRESTQETAFGVKDCCALVYRCVESQINATGGHPKPSFAELCYHYSAMRAARYVFMEYLLSFNSKPTESTIHFRDSLGTLWVLTNRHDNQSIDELVRYQYNCGSQHLYVGVEECADLVYDCIESQKRGLNLYHLRLR